MLNALSYSTIAVIVLKIKTLVLLCFEIFILHYSNAKRNKSINLKKKKRIITTLQNFNVLLYCEIAHIILYTNP